MSREVGWVINSHVCVQGVWVSHPSVVVCECPESWVNSSHPERMCRSSVVVFVSREGGSSVVVCVSREGGRVIRIVFVSREAHQ